MGLATGNIYKIIVKLKKYKFIKAIGHQLFFLFLSVLNDVLQLL